MIAFLSLLPCAAVIVAVLALRLSALSASIIALVTAMALWALGIFSPIQLDQLGNAVTDALVLELLVGVVVYFGLLFVEVSSRGGGLGALGNAIQTLRLSPPKAVILITVGIGVMLESLTGYGVSMLVTVPLLLQIVSRTKTICLALIGMSLMSWGALSVAALLGAELSGLTTEALAAAILTTSGPIALVLPLFCLLIIQNVNLRDVVYALCAGGVLVSGIALTSRWIGVEVAGVGGGLAVILFSLVFSMSKQNLGKALTAPAILPYGLLIAGVVLQKIIVPYLYAMGLAPVIDTGRVSFHVLQSPGIALLVISLLCLLLQSNSTRSKSGQPLFQHVTARSWRALASILFFLITARLLVEIGGIAALSGLMSQLGLYPAVALITVLGGIGAYATGSGVTAVALFMPSAAATGEGFDALALFAALQHSGAAHVAMASLPVIAILLAALPDRDAADEQIAIRTGLGLAAIWILFVIASGATQLAMTR
ncbi:MAG: hypothetical protein HN478_14825 [Rhodospirillaceae bacterium]|nr:hypothetical protein [Rhodospirillaceae bacterium]MBT5194326.1 hypothetical protein [Rhodospirillaceae bacterium]MBT5894385.1 hypothetical protein [Rhodospirillaceae bacterium]MBT6429649.1 hypothetical protein [Rhodospirillaceae bacterium]MBT7756064.1 hypothetical protein [Rhodospirillaceae bacterium]